LPILDEAAITGRYGIPGRAYADFALLRGDPSDGLPGVPGIGDKTAAALISAFGSLDGLLAALDGERATEIPAAARKRLAAARDYLAVAPTVVRIVRDASVPRVDLTLPAAPRDPAALERLAAEYGLDGPVKRLREALRAR